MSTVGPLCQENPRAARLTVMQELRAAAGRWRQGVRFSAVSIATPFKRALNLSKTWFLQCCNELTPAQILAYLHVSAGGTGTDGGASCCARSDRFPVPGRQVPGESGGAARLPDLPAQHHPHHPGLAPQPHTPPPRHPATTPRQHAARLSTAGFNSK